MPRNVNQPMAASIFRWAAFSPAAACISVHVESLFMATSIPHDWHQLYCIQYPGTIIAKMSFHPANKLEFCSTKLLSYWTIMVYSFSFFPLSRKKRTSDLSV